MIVVVGATTWGTTLAVTFARAGKSTLLLVRDAAEAERLNAARMHSRRLPGVEFPGLLAVAHQPEWVESADIVVMATPSQTMRQNVRQIVDHLPANVSIISAAKGLETDTLLRMSEVIDLEAPGIGDRVGALSGPNLGREVAAGLPGATVVAMSDRERAAQAQEILMTPRLRVYTNSDLVGVELGGALKNVYALAAGVCDGLRMGDNAKAGLITRGLAEMTRLGRAAGAQAQTFAGLAGLGDLVATCASPLSRNHQVGVRLAQGEELSTILADLGQVAEGVTTTQAAVRLGHQLGVELPITEMMARVLFRGLAPSEAAAALMLREATTEFGA